MSTKSKIMGLCDKSLKLILQMKHESDMQEKYKKFIILNIIAKRLKFWQDISFYIVKITFFFYLMNFNFFNNYSVFVKI